MQWIVKGEKQGRLELVSKSSVAGMLPKGSFLTIENNDALHVVRVDDTEQVESYRPSTLVAEMDLGSIAADQACQNIITASRVKDITTREDGLVDFIPPQSTARLATQEEVDAATDASTNGAPVFISTLHATQTQKLRGKDGKAIVTRVPDSAYFHQMLICGKTGAGKTVGTKYLAQHFVEEMDGAVLAVNVKDIDFLQMDQPSHSSTDSVHEEWDMIGQSAHGVYDFTVYHPPNIDMGGIRGVNPDRCRAVTLDVKAIEPESLTGLLQGITDLGAQSFPGIFRHWQRQQLESGGDFSFGDFVRYFAGAGEAGREFPTRSERGEESHITLHSGTYQNIQRNLDYAVDFFDNAGAKVLDGTEILTAGKMSVINVAGGKGVQFGAVLLRDLLTKIVALKDRRESDVPILIIIDEVHQFYHSDASKEALGELDTICRTGRSKKIGVIFSSQTPQDIPRGLSSVINTQIFFKSDQLALKSLGFKVSDQEMSNLKQGYALTLIHDLPQVRVIKFPMALAGVNPEE